MASVVDLLNMSLLICKTLRCTLLICIEAGVHFIHLLCTIQSSLLVCTEACRSFYKAEKLHIPVLVLVLALVLVLVLALVHHHYVQELLSRLTIA